MIKITQEEIMQNWGTDNSEVPLVSVKCMTFNHEKTLHPENVTLTAIIPISLAEKQSLKLS